MKIFKLAVIIFLFVAANGCASSKPVPASSGVNTGSPSRIAAGAGADELDRVIREISDYLNRRIPKGAKAVFLNIKSNWPDLSEYILSGLSENAVNDEVFAVVDRQQLDAIRAELNFQWSGEVSDASAQEIGQMLGAQTIVSGTVTAIGSVYRIQARAIAVQTAAVQGQFSQNVDSKGPTITALTRRVVPAGSSAAAAGSRANTGTQTAQTPATGGTAATPAQPAAPAQSGTTYKIGDRGPAGGLIFYDKGNNNGGWRYLEAAPANIDGAFVALSENINTDNCGERAVGKGKSNTTAIMKEAAKIGGGHTWAAYKCVNYTQGGYNDWFLPSRDELSYMYGNLHAKELGGFRNERYWSSTAEGSYSFWNINFYDGSQSAHTYEYTFRVRPIRQF